MAEEVGRQHVDAVRSFTLLFPASVCRITVVTVCTRRSTCCQHSKQTNHAQCS